MVREYKRDAQTTESVNEYLKFDFLPYKSSIDSLYGVTQKLQTMNQHPTKANTFSYVFPRETQNKGN